MFPYTLNPVPDQDHPESAVASCSWLQNLLSVQDRLPGTTKLKLWNAGLFDGNEYGDNFRQFQEGRRSPSQPLTACHLPGEFLGEDGEVDAFSDRRFYAWKGLLEEADGSLLSPQERNSSLPCVLQRGKNLC